MIGEHAAFSPPLSNRGGRDFSAEVESCEIYQRYAKCVIDSKGRVVEVPLRRGVANSAFIDSISFTFKRSALAKFTPFAGESDVDDVVTASDVLFKIFGFGVTSKAVGKGNRRYNGYWRMEVDGVHYGDVHCGGNNDTMLVELKGKGCEVAKDGWEARLYNFLSQADGARITRCDVAADYFNNEITPDLAWEAWQLGEFDKRGKRPIVDRYGSDWDCGTTNGKTLYVGSRNSGIYARIYDKAKEQGDKDAVWTRFECQFLGRNVKIDLDILLQPGAFFGGAFPICGRLQDLGIEAVRSMATDKRLEMSIEACKDAAAKQCGRAINMLLAMGLNAEQIVEELRNKDDLVPARLNPAAYSLLYSNKETFLHERSGKVIAIPGEWDDVDDFIGFNPLNFDNPTLPSLRAGKGFVGCSNAANN